MRKINIWLDCDPGIDDAVAIAMIAASRDQLNLCGISTVAGNQISEKVLDNALRLTSYLGLEEIPVVCGASAPLIRQIEVAEAFHGKTGLGNVELPETSKKPASQNAVPFMRDCIMQLPENEKIILLPTGPLTNIALLFKVFPEVKERVEKVVLMGGSSAVGNVTPTAEFNIWADPEAAKIVYDAGIPIVMCGLDVTSSCGLTRKQTDVLCQSAGLVQRTFGNMLRFYLDAPQEKRDFVCIHDAVTVLYLTDPYLFDGIKVSVEIDCSTDINRGMTVCDRRKYITHENDSVLLLNQVEAEEFQKVILQKLSCFNT